MLRGKKIILGVSASIAAYKATYIVRHFIKAGAEVRVVQTPASKDFVTPLSLSTLSKNEVLSDFINEEDENAMWHNHVDLALWADYIVIAPATSNTLAKMVQGLCDNLLMGVYLSAKCPVYIAPAMDLDMYKHESTQSNLKKLKAYGNRIIPVGSGELASGLSGEGRMAEPEEIIDFITKDIQSQLPLKGKKVLINGGPTYERIDAVRFIGNFSSGKMGIALADAAFEMGAEVHLVLGPTHLRPENEGIAVTRVESADQMFEACKTRFLDSDIAIFSAAVADFKPSHQATEKIKKTEGIPTINLVPNQDILATLASQKKSNQTVVGFALETRNAEEYAKKKLAQKNLDWVVMNSLKDKGAGFGGDTNKVTMFGQENKVIPFELMSKKDVALKILNTLLS